jgi:hypothetical protein
MSELREPLESAFEDKLHALARKFNKAGLSLQAIADSFSARGWFAKKYLVGRDVEYPKLYSALTAKRRALGHAQ